MFDRITGRVNPFSKKVFDYPGIIYPCSDIKADILALRSKIETSFQEVIMEYGSGSGNHLIELAKRNTDKLCIGFEIRFKRAVRTIEKAELSDVKNINIFRAKGEFAPEIFPANRVSEIYINFPDPWDKKRWLKHRVLTRSVIESFFPILKKGGFFSIKTDHRSYFDTFVSEIEEGIKEGLELTFEFKDPELVRVNQYPDAEVIADLKKYNVDIESEFENLFRNKGQTISYCRLRKQ